METLDIDLLLERYLALVDEYTKLRSQLNQLQINMYQNIARANFSAERGIRYGPDLYDERMQALRQVNISLVEDHGPSFEVTFRPIEVADDLSTEKEPREAEQEKRSPPRPKDPLRWFGVLTPMPLRLAQKEAKQAVEEIIPRLVSVSAEMAEVEIQVRRQKKRRAKAEAKAKKQEKAAGSRTELKT